MGSLAYNGSWLARIGRAVQAAVFPYRCLGCDDFFFPSEDNRLSAGSVLITLEGGRFQERLRDLVNPFLCGRCSQSVTLLTSPLCRVCGMPFKSSAGEDHTCGACLTAPQRFDMARACGRYDEGLKDLIHWFKYRNVPQLAQPLGALLAWGFWNYFGDREIDMILPVPLHSRRMRSRGFNQAYLLARAATADSFNYGHLQRLPAIAEKVLVRIRATPPQTGLGRELRRKNIRNAFRAPHTAAVKGKSILLVDDVFTTGATVNECARILKIAGARWVGVLSVARAD